MPLISQKMFKQHLAGRCPAGKCLNLVHYYIDPKLCRGKGECAAVCPRNAIEGGKGFISVIDEFECDKCGICLDKCPEHAIKMVSGKLPKLPDEPISLSGSKTDKSENNPVRRKRVRPVKPAKLYTNKIKNESNEQEEVHVKGDLPVKEMEADVIIVAGGPAGLAAAVTAGENNLTSIVFEKSNTTGGAANMGMGPLGIDTKVQRRNFNQISFEKAFELHMDYTHWRVDADLVIRILLKVRRYNRMAGRNGS